MDQGLFIHTLHSFPLNRCTADRDERALATGGDNPVYRWKCLPEPYASRSTIKSNWWSQQTLQGVSDILQSQSVWYAVYVLHCVLPTSRIFFNAISSFSSNAYFQVGKNSTFLFSMASILSLENLLPSLIVFTVAWIF